MAIDVLGPTTSKGNFSRSEHPSGGTLQCGSTHKKFPK